MKSWIKKFTTAIIICAFLFNLFTESSSIYASTPSNSKISDQINIIGIDDSTDYIIKYKNFDKGKVAVGKKAKKIRDFQRLKLSKAKLDARDLESLKKDSNIEYIEPDYPLEMSGDMVDINLKQIHVPEVHENQFYGDGIKVAVFDTGIDTESTELRIAGGASFVDNEPDYDDNNGHGTMVAGILAALNDDTGLVGVAPNVKLYAVKVLDEQGSGSYSQVIAALEWAVANDIDIVSMSFAGRSDSRALREAIQLANNNGVLLIGAAGNNGSDIVSFPALYEQVISVGAVDQYNKPAYFTNRGKVDLVAPGVHVSGLTLTKGAYTSGSGTSFAVPFVTGVAALLKQAQPQLQNVQIRDFLKEGAIPLGSPALFGSGLVNAARSFKQLGFDIQEEIPENANDDGDLSFLTEFPPLKTSVSEVDDNEISKLIAMKSGEENEYQLDPNLIQIQASSDTNILNALRSMTIKTNEAPFKVSAGNETISPISGSLSTAATDLFLPGRNGLSFALTRTYDSASSQLYEPGYETKFYCDCVITYKTYSYLEKKKKDANGNFESGSLLLNYQVNNFAYSSSQGHPWMSDLFDAVSWLSYIQPKISGQTITETAWTTVPDYDGYYSRYVEKGTSDFTFSQSIAVYLGTRSIAKQPTQEEKSSPIGKGWSWNIPSIKTVEGKKYINLGNNSVYEIDINSLAIKDYPWKDLSISYDSTVTVNGERSSYALSNLSGVKHYFTSDGRLIQIADRYNNTIQFKYIQKQEYGLVLSSITDVIGNSIQITYNANEVVLKQGSKTVTYHKSKLTRQYHRVPIELYTEVLDAVTDVAGRQTKYQYEVKNAYAFISEEAAINPYLLLSGIDYPTGAQTKYVFEKNPLPKFTTSMAYSESYRLSSRYEVIGTSTYNKTDLSYTGNISYPATGRVNFSTKMNNGLTTTTYNNRREYFDDNTPNMYYTDSVVQTDGVQQRVTNYLYDEAKKRTSPIQTSTNITSNGQSSTSAIYKSTYDDFGNVLTSTDPNNQQTSFQYDSSGLLSSVTQPIDTIKKQFIQYIRNNKGTITQIITRENNSAGKLLSQLYLEDIDPATGNIRKMRQLDDNREVVKTIEYDPVYQSAYPSKETVVTKNYEGNSQSNSISYQYDLPTGQVTKIIDGNSNATSYKYDVLGRVTNVINPDNSSSSIEYNDLLNRVRATDETGVVTESRFNQLGWPTETGNFVNGNFNRLSYNVYDVYGQLDYQLDGQGRKTDYNYDKWGRVVYEKYGPGETTISYDDVNRKKIITDAQGNRIASTFDILGQVVKTEQLLQNKTVVMNQTEYNHAGLVTKSIDSNNQSTFFNYDALGRLVSVTNPKGEQTSYTYSLLGLLSKVEFPDHTYELNRYDELGRLIQKTDPSGDVEKYKYDANGNLVNFVNRKNEVVSYEYNKRNLLGKEAATTEVITYTYDLAGRRKSMTDNTGTSNYNYNPSTGQLSSVVFPDGRQMTYEYDKIGNRTKSTDPFGQQTDYVYYSDRNLLKGVGQVTGWENESDPLGLDAKYEYNNSGQTAKVQFSNGTTQNYTYKDLNLDSVVHKASNGAILSSFAYAYDDNGNIKSKTENNQTHVYTYDSLNRIKTNSQYNETYSYDIKGNRLTLESGNPPAISLGQYEYDKWNRLTKVTNEDGSTVTYRYNGDGLLYERTENGQTTRYYWDGDQIAAEATIINGSPSYKASYIRGNGLVARKASDGTKGYYLTNGHGDVTEIRNSNGGLLNKYNYDIWGNPTVVQKQTDNPFMYSGEMWDEKVGLQYLRARWYDPTMGRFINEDTYEGQIDNPLSLNLYTYVQNNPLIYSDPSGFMPTEIEAAEMAANVYTVTQADIKKGIALSGGWTPILMYTNDESLKMVVYSRYLSERGTYGSYEYTIANKGTNFTWDDIKNDLQQPIGYSTDMEDSIFYSTQFVEDHMSSEITFVGHSKGGAEAIANAVATNRNAITFNPAVPNLSAYGLDGSSYTGYLRNFVVKNEILNTVMGEPSVGQMVYLPQYYKYSWWQKAVDFWQLKVDVQNHKMVAVKGALAKAGYH